MHAALRTGICDLFGITYPIVQTGMGWVATPALVAATANAGALGFLAAATLTPDEAEASIVRVRQLAPTRPFGVNFLMEQPGIERVLESVLEHEVGVVSYSRSPRPEVIDRLKEAGVRCVPTVGAVRHAVKAVDLGADALIVQGGEGGGHTGTVPTSLLLPQVVDAVDVPVLAAGGFRDGRGLVAALAYGASGVAMGTRFLLTREAPVDVIAKQRYLATGVTDTVVTRAIDGLPQRVILNRLVDDLQSSGRLRTYLRALRSAFAYRRLSGASVSELLRAGLAMRRSERLSSSQLLMAANAPVLVRRGLLEGRAEDGVLPSGQVAGLIDDLPSVADLIERIVAEATQVLEQLSPTQRSIG